MSTEKHTRGVIALMSSVDSHLQGMLHYSYGREQREAMGIVQEMLTELIEQVRLFDQYDDCEAIDATFEARQRARALIAKATGEQA